MAPCEETRTGNNIHFYYRQWRRTLGRLYEGTFEVNCILTKINLRTLEVAVIGPIVVVKTHLLREASEQQPLSCRQNEHSKRK